MAKHFIVHTQLRLFVSEILPGDAIVVVIKMRLITTKGRLLVPRVRTANGKKMAGERGCGS